MQSLNNGFTGSLFIYETFEGKQPLKMNTKLLQKMSVSKAVIPGAKLVKDK